MVIMSKEGKHEKVVVIQSCIEASWGDLKWLQNALMLTPGDELLLVEILHKNPPSPTAKLLGFNNKRETNKVLASTKIIIEEELNRRKEEYSKHPWIMQLQKLYEKEKVKVSAEVEAGSSRRVAVLRATKKFGATWLILDREMKKDKQYFLDRLSCGISSMKSNHTIVKIRDPIDPMDVHVSYGEMIPSYSWEDVSPPSQKSPGKATDSCKESMHGCSRLLLDSNQRLASASTSMEVKRYSSLLNPTFNEHMAFRPPKTPKKVQNLRTLLNLPEGSHATDMDCDHKSVEEEEFENSVCSVCKNRRPKIVWQRDFTYAELYEATERFSTDNFLSEGGFGFVFRGKLKNGMAIAVKQHKAASLQGEKEFKSEVSLLSRARHPNLVMLLGSCSEGSHRLLVYEYVCNGSLEEQLSDVNPLPLNWEKRIKIALGAARGLEYLHSQNIIHRDMRPSNILITHDHESLLGDFGLAKAQKDYDTVHSSDSGVVGTLGYMAPEYAESGKMSTKTDVYSFGVVLLQLITGLRTTDDIPEGKSLVGWAKPLLETKNYPDLIDKKIVDSHDVHQLFWMVLVAEKCLKNYPDDRCTMEQVVRYLTSINEGQRNVIADFLPSERDFW